MPETAQGGFVLDDGDVARDRYPAPPPKRPAGCPHTKFNDCHDPETGEFCSTGAALPPPTGVSEDALSFGPKPGTDEQAQFQQMRMALVRLKDDNLRVGYAVEQAAKFWERRSTSPLAMALQAEVAKETGAKFFWPREPGVAAALVGDGAAMAEKKKLDMPNAARTIYALTQKSLEGKVELTVYRGVHERDDGFMPDPGTALVKQNPLSSWTTFMPIAERFSGSHAGEAYIIEAKVPVGRVFATGAVMNGAAGGAAWLDEREVVVMGGAPLKGRVIRIDPRTGIFPKAATQTVSVEGPTNSDWLKSMRGGKGAKYSPDQPRDDQGQWTEGGAAAWGRLKETIDRPDGGFTVQPVSGDEPKVGFAVSPYPGRSVQLAGKDEFTWEAFNGFVKKNADVFANRDHYFGAWHDPESGKIWLDVSVVKATEAEAVALAVAHDQIAYFDFSTGKSVPVGGTGGGKGRAEPGETEREVAGRALGEDVREEGDPGAGQGTRSLAEGLIGGSENTVDFSGWRAEELEAYLARDAKLRGKAESGTSHDDPPKPEPGQRKRPDTILIAGLLWQQIASYQRKLQRQFDRGVGQLSGIAEAGGGQSGVDDVLAATAISMAALAPAFFRRAFETGADFAVEFTGESGLTTDEADAIVKEMLDSNARFVGDSLMPDLKVRYGAVLSQQEGAPAAEVAAAVDELADSFGARVGMYAFQLWGAGHRGFAEEMQGAGELLEWVVTSGNPCVDCPGLEAGSPYGPDNPLPTFPGAGDTQCLCFVDGKTMVFTDRGWRRINQIVIGDSVLSHTGHFRKVYRLPVAEKTYAGDIVDVTVRCRDQSNHAKYNDLTLKVTAVHPFLVNGEWRPAETLTAGERLTTIIKACCYCGGPIPLRGRDSKRDFCSRMCQARIVGAAGWAKGRARLIEKHGSYGSWFKGMAGRPWTEGQKSVARAARLGKTYEEFMGAEKAAAAKEKIGALRRGKTLMELYGAERAAAISKALHRHAGRPSRLEDAMCELLDSLFIPYARLAAVGGYEVDILIPDKKIVIECDGEYWHEYPRGTAADARKTAAMEAAGYTVLRFWGAEIMRRSDDVASRILRVLANHDGRYSHGDVEIISVRRRTPRKPVRLYDLSVDGDHSYVVNGGVVSHNSNCLCLLRRWEGGKSAPAPDYAPARGGSDARSADRLTAATILAGQKAEASSLRTAEAIASAVAALPDAFSKVKIEVVVNVEKPDPVVVNMPEVRVDVAAPHVEVKVPEPKEPKGRKVKRTVIRDPLTGLATGSVEEEQ